MLRRKQRDSSESVGTPECQNGAVVEWQRRPAAGLTNSAGKALPPWARVESVDRLVYGRRVFSSPFLRVASLARSLALASVGSLMAAEAPLVINEIHHSPVPRQEWSEFVELHNRSGAAVPLAGWRLAGGVDYTFAGGATLPAGGFVVIAQNPARVRLRYAATNVVGPWVGTLSSENDRLRLFNPGNQEVQVVDFGRSFPWPTVGGVTDASLELLNPALDNSLGGHWRPSSAAPTPGRRNSVQIVNAPPALSKAGHSPQVPHAGEPVVLTVRAEDPDGVASVEVEYQIVEPGSFIQSNDPTYATQWTRVTMVPVNTQDYQVTLPAEVQQHRRMVRYRFIAKDTLGAVVRAPLPDDTCPNFAYFVYNGVPAWTGAVRPGVAGVLGQPFTVPAEEMNRLPTFHLIARESEVLVATGWAPGKPNNQYRGDDYLWTGALVYQGTVYDHIHFRMRGGVWRYSMGKNAWKFDFNRGHELAMQDNWGGPFNVTWGKLSLRPDIQQGDYEHRGEQGLFESVGYRLFQLAGTDANNCVHVQLRVVDRAEEAPATNQFNGDLWGKYLAVEEQDGRWLNERGLPDGNIYDMENFFGAPNHLGQDGPVDSSDLSSFLGTYTGANSGSLSESWWRTNLNLPSYFGYQIILQGIHHYDIQDGKNYFYYHNSANGQWSVQPWDLDLTWADTMYRGGNRSGFEPFLTPVLNGFNWTGNRLPNIRREFRNRVREVRDLLFNPEQAGQVIDEQALLIHGTNLVSFTDADRAQWDYNPVMLNGSITLASKAGTGRFYQKGVGSKTFAGMVQLMKNYVKFRATSTTYSLDTIAREVNIPTTPELQYSGPDGFPSDALRFTSSGFDGVDGFGSVQYRIAEITRLDHPGYEPGKPWHYEIQAVWESPRYTQPTRNISVPGEFLQAGRLYRARVRHWDATGRASHWSAPVEFTAGVGDPTAALRENLELTEILYAPATGGYEFIELHNRNLFRSLNLAGVVLAGGIDYPFPTGMVLPPNGYLVVTRSGSASGLRAYHRLPRTVPVLGPYNRSLSNSGDSIAVLPRAGAAPVFSVTYGARAPWPTSAVDTGRSLVPRPGAPANSSVATDWRASLDPFGSPGRGESDLVLPVAWSEPAVVDGRLQLRLLHSPGQRVRLEASDDLRAWQTVQTGLSPGLAEVPAGEAQRYFRAVAQ